jgi:hypothetical protein
MIKNNKIFEPQNIRHFISESWANSWPMTLIMFFEFLIGLTDIYIAGRVGKEIQATYGFVIQLYFIFIIIANALLPPGQSPSFHDYSPSEIKTLSTKRFIPSSSQQSFRV